MHQILICIVMILVQSSTGEICYSTDIRNEPENLEHLRNCTIIAGSLKILLFDQVLNEDEISVYRFPNLIEITHYLLFFRVYQLVTLEHMFPNLRVIRGMKLFTNYALVIFEMPHLKEIGLKNLVYIPRGSIKVDNCPNLCYVDTINWKKMGATQLDFADKNTNCLPCPEKCNGTCWSQKQCQKFQDKTESCLIRQSHVVPEDPFERDDDENGIPSEFLQEHTTKFNNSQILNFNSNGTLKGLDPCLSCRTYENNGTCVKSCPANKYVNKALSRCVTASDCPRILAGTWWLFENQCINICPPQYDFNKTIGGCTFCGEKCVRECFASKINSISTLQRLWGCTHVGGDIELIVTQPYLAKELEEYMGKIVSINGSLKIIRSPEITTLEFLRSLHFIGGDEFRVYDNPNLVKLWTFDQKFKMRITSTKVVFYNNPRLCYSEIEQLANLTQMRIYREMVKLGNGFKSLCNIRELNVKILEIRSTSVYLTWDEVLTVLRTLDNTTNIGYTIFFRETGERNVSIYDEEDQCEFDGWRSAFVASNTYNLTDLKPYSRYAFYLQTYSSNSTLREQTAIHYFVTQTDDPSEPVNVTANSTAYNTIFVRWLPPQFTNGVLSHYTITVYLEDDNLDALRNRNFCTHPHKVEPPPEQYYIMLPPFVRGRSKATTVSTVYYPLRNISSIAKSTRYHPTADCMCTKDGALGYSGQYKEYVCDPRDSKWNPDDNFCDNFLYQVGGAQSPVAKRTPPIKKELLAPQRNPALFQELATNGVNATNLTIFNLRQFSLYIVLVSACNVNTTDSVRHCSPVVMDMVRTKRRITADLVRSVSAKVVERKNVLVKWYEPIQPNGKIFAYHVEYRRTGALPSKECLTHDQFIRNKRSHTITYLQPGRYSIRVRAVSYAGPANFSQRHYIEIYPPRIAPDYSWLYSLGLVFIFAVMVVGVLGWKWWRDIRRTTHDLHLIASINPDYAGIYIEDDWELERSDVELHQELGKGSFGMVYAGRIKSRNSMCAVKTVNETATTGDRIEFLNEGSVMKNFHDSQHVVKLLGIVSRGQPPYVVMELMECGDLKRYLHRCREPSQNLTSNESYRMAAEIADGMAYLAAKKYVHRDLAARNCMVHADRTVKIGDFGMARDIYETDYYRKETVGLLPVRWMAPESLIDGVFTTDSDCWSYGIVLWEISTLAEQPYQGLSNEEVFRHVRSGGKLNRPRECSDKFYEIMRSCWHWKPNDRPTFRDVVDDLAGHVGEGFRLVAFAYSKKGQDLALNAGPRPYNPPALREGAITFYEEDENLEEEDENVDDESVSLDDENDELAVPGPSHHRPPIIQRQPLLGVPSTSKDPRFLTTTYDSSSTS